MKVKPIFPIVRLSLGRRARLHLTWSPGEKLVTATPCISAHSTDLANRSSNSFSIRFASCLKSGENKLYREDLNGSFVILNSPLTISSDDHELVLAGFER